MPGNLAADVCLRARFFLVSFDCGSLQCFLQCTFYDPPRSFREPEADLIWFEYRLVDEVVFTCGSGGSGRGN